MRIIEDVNTINEIRESARKIETMRMSRKTNREHREVFPRTQKFCFCQVREYPSDFFEVP